MEHFCKFVLFNQSCKTVLSKHLHVTVLIFVSGFRLIFLIFYCFCTVGLSFRIIFELYIIMFFVFLFCKIWLRLGSRAKRNEVHSSSKCDYFSKFYTAIRFHLRSGIRPSKRLYNAVFFAGC